MGHLQCEGKKTLTFCSNHMRRYVCDPSIASCVGKVCAENSISSLNDVMEEMIRVVMFFSFLPLMLATL